jgi:hypothetical protein
LAVKANLLEVQEHQEMSALFPSFLGLGQRLKRLLATDIKSIWQALEELQVPPNPAPLEVYVVGDCLYWEV